MGVSFPAELLKTTGLVPCSACPYLFGGLQGDGAWEPRPKCCRRSSLKATGSSNSTDDQVRLGGTHRGEAPCLRCKTSSGTTKELSQGSKGSSSDRSSLAEDLFESQGNGTPASHPRGAAWLCPPLPASPLRPNESWALAKLMQLCLHACISWTHYEIWEYC